MIDKQHLLSWGLTLSRVRGNDGCKQPEQTNSTGALLFLMYRVFCYFGCDDGWCPVTDYVDVTTAARRLRLRRSCRGWLHTYSIRRKHSDRNLDLSDLPFAFSAQ